MFTGRRLDTETGLYYYRARMYSPEIGRFLQVDPIGYADSMNLYMYVGNNPIILIDPYGLCRDSTSWVMDGVIASGFVWADVLGGFGKFGRMDTFDPGYANTIINQYPNAGEPGVSIKSEKFWSHIHEYAGLGLGLVGVDETSAYNILQTWESTEAIVWPTNTPLIHRDHQGRNVFEDGQEGIERDMRDGMAGYEAGRAVSPVFWTIYNTYNIYKVID